MEWIEFEIPRKTTKIFELKFTKDGLCLDITGWKIYFTLKENMSDSDTDAKISKDILTHLNSTGGITDIELNCDDTNLTPKSYYYDIKWVDTEANAGILFNGRITITEPVTTRT